MSINFKDKVNPCENVLVKELESSTVILNLNNENYYGLNEISYTMYQFLINSKNIDSAFNNLCDEFDENKEIIKNDLTQLIKELEQAQIIKLTSST